MPGPCSHVLEVGLVRSTFHRLFASSWLKDISTAPAASQTGRTTGNAGITILPAGRNEPSGNHSRRRRLREDWQDFFTLAGYSARP